MQVILDGQSLNVDTGTVYVLLQKQGKSFYRLDHPFYAFIQNPDCPLLNLVEVNGQIYSAPALKQKLVQEGMEINTESETIKKLLAERLEKLEKDHECLLIREMQEIVARDAADSRLLDFEARQGWQFELRKSWPSTVHDANKCVRCGGCVTICNEIQEVGALRMDPEQGVLIDDQKCVRCGQCVLVCPLGYAEQNIKAFVEWMGCKLCPFSQPVAAFHEENNIFDVWEALQDKDKFVVVQFAPSVRASLGELFDMPAGSLVMGKLYAALRRLGFDHVGDTNFGADLTIMEEGHELVKRITEGGVLPQFTSCCPAWIRYCETFYPELIPHISSAKSPQQMFGPIAKTYLAEKRGIDPRKMIVVSIMPCTAKKFECTREEMCDAWKYWIEKGEVGEGERFPDVDYVLTTRECARLLKMGGIDLKEMPEEKPDPLVGEYTGAATIFGRTGGVMEAALRTAYEVITGKGLSKLEFEILGGLNNIKTAEIGINGKKIKVAVAHSLKAVKEICDSVKAGGEFAKCTFIEFMACPGGCIGGGGQPVLTSLKTIEARIEGLNTDDRHRSLRKSHENPEIKQLYQDFLKEPLSHLSHHLLHTTYRART